MILIKLQGGLGNQLFQYAMGRALSIKTGKTLFLDVVGLEKPVEGHLPRNYMLSDYNIKAEIAIKRNKNSF